MTSWTSGSVLSSDTMDPYEIDIAQTKTMQIDIPLVVQGRDVMKELDEMRDVLLLIKRDVNCGSGFSDSDRDSFWSSRSGLIGQLVEVRADAITQNQDGTYSLRFPRFKTFRGFEVGEKI